MSLGKGRTQQTVEAFKELLCGVSSQTGDIFGNMRTAKAWQTKKSTGFTNRMERNKNESDIV